MGDSESRRETLAIELADEAATSRLARALARLARPGDVIALQGDLGSGKTTFARAFINALPRTEDVEAATEEPVPSPTFTLVQVYERAPAPVWHFDLYRIDMAEEAYELGVEEALGTGITLIEWPERLGALLPADRLLVRFDFGAGSRARQISLSGGGGWTQRLRSLRAGAAAS